jgi:hypothetical protein
MLANPEVSVALDSLDKKPTGFAIGFWIIAETFASLKHLLKN